MYSSNVVNSVPCFGTPHVPSSGSLCGCYHKASEWSVVQKLNELTFSAKKLIPQTNYHAMRGACDIEINEEDSKEFMPKY